MLKKIILPIFMLIMTFNVSYAEEINFIGEENIEIIYPTGGIVLREQR
ncbi:MAG: hypothetical protein IKK18_00670 [Clostridia bacterium]|nr:hypothetical protein [Clostridia bacterium]